MLKPIAFLLTLAGFFGASEVRAQHIFHHKAPYRGVASSSTSYPSCYPGTSYGPSMGYAGSGYNDFPFHGGGSYAHPFDRWTWPNMSGAYGQGLARYYDPPVK